MIGTFHAVDGRFAISTTGEIVLVETGIITGTISNYVVPAIQLEVTKNALSVGTTSLPGILSVADVQGRYGLLDPRAARERMHAAGGFVSGNRLVIRADDLDIYEREQAAAVKRVYMAAESPQEPARRSARATAPSTGPKLQDAAERYRRGWWRNEPSEGG